MFKHQFESFISELETKSKNDKTTETPDVLEVQPFCFK